MAIHHVRRLLPLTKSHNRDKQTGANTFFKFWYRVEWVSVNTREQLTFQPVEVGFLILFMIDENRKLSFIFVKA